MIWVTTDPVNAADVEKAMLKWGTLRNIHWRKSDDHYILTIKGLSFQQELSVMRGQYRDEDLDAWREGVKRLEVEDSTKLRTLKLIEYLRRG